MMNFLYRKMSEKFIRAALRHAVIEVKKQQEIRSIYKRAGIEMPKYEPRDFKEPGHSSSGISPWWLLFIFII